MLPDSDFLAVQQALAGQYSLERELGRGGMGIVYLAREVSLDRLVAIKVLPPALATRTGIRERFMREARTAARLSHPNIVPIFRVGEAGPYVYFAMAYVDGETVGQRIRARGPFPAAEASRILREAAWALAYAHAQGVVHRDVKPDNILLERGSGRALLTDFGIAHVAEASALTDERVVMGTAHFMSPEQGAGDALDGRSDLYSLGIVGYLMLTGRLPFDAPTVPAVLAKHLMETPPPLTGDQTPVPVALARVVERCLAKAPEARWPSGEELADALGQASEERRELPAPLRVWLQKRDPLAPLYLIWSGISAFSAYGMVLQSLAFPQQARLSLAPRFLLLALAPLIPLGAYHLHHAWRALRAGYSRMDLAQALREHAARLREETAFTTPNVPRWLARAIQVLTYGSWAALVGFITAVPFIHAMRGAGALIHVDLSPWLVLGVPAGLTVAGSILGVTFPGKRLSPARVAELRLKFWESRVGRWTAKLLGEGRRHAPDQLVDRPTELAIGHAAGLLFEALPKATRARLGDLPGVVRQLEEHAATMRSRVAELDQLLVSVRTPERHSGTLAADGAAAASIVAQRGTTTDHLPAARGAAASRLATTVAALETIRLDLLRLQGGAEDLGPLTAIIEQAHRLDDDVRRMVEGHDAARGAVGR